MKVLVTGGYGFIGSHIAERFHKEGYEVFIIDNLSSGKQEHVAFKHKGYILSVEDERCAEVYQSNHFDIVVHLAAQVSVAKSVSNPSLDSETNVAGLVNMLQLAHQNHVKTFIYASSAAVYGAKDELPIKEEDSCSPISPYGISKWAGEVYGNKWNELYGLQTIGFRFSNVYGPRQSVHGEGGVIASFMNKAMARQPLTIHGDGNQTRDFIYVEDIADAIYRASLSSVTGIYNLSTNTQNSVNALIDILRGIYGEVEVRYGESRAGDIAHSRLSNERVMRDLDWSPMYTLEEGLQRTHAYILQDETRRETSAGSTEKRNALANLGRYRMNGIVPYLENLLVFALTAWLTVGQQNSEYSFIDINMFYIAVVGIVYGNRQSIIAVVLSIALYVYEKLDNGREFISLMYDTETFMQAALYLFIGLVIGYSIERKNNQLFAQEQKIADIENKYEFLSGVYNEVREVKEELQLRILNADDSYGKIFAITKELESLDPEHVFTATVNVVKSIMNVKDVSIYRVDRSGNYLRLAAQSADRSIHAPKSLEVQSTPYVHAVLQNGQVFVNKQLIESAPSMCAPIAYNKRIASVIAIDGLSFEKFTLYHQNLFKITADLVSSALSRAFAYLEATEDQRYMQGTSVLREKAFESILETKRAALQKNHTPYLLLCMEDSETQWMEQKQMSEKIASQLRETDYIGLLSDGELGVLLSNSTKDDALHVTARLAKSGIMLRVMEEGL